MLRYPVRLIPTAEGLVCARVVDVPEATAIGGSEEEALAILRLILEAVLGRYRAAGRTVPAPSDICGAPVVCTDKFGLVDMDLPSS